MPHRRASTSPAYRFQRTPRLRYFGVATIPGVKRSPARLVIALSVAAALAVFILYTSIAGAGTPQIQASDLHKYVGQDVTLVGKVVTTHGDAHSAAGMHFVLRDVKTDSGTHANVVYHG